MKRKRYVYLEFSINAITLGKVFFQLFNDDEVQKAIENFVSLCQGNKYHSIYGDDILSYKNCKVEKIKREKCIKSGYLQNKIKCDKYGSINTNTFKREKNKEKEKYEKVECIYGRCFDKTYSTRKHLNAGLLTMVDIGRKKYSSVFKITLGKVKKYDRKNIIIGRVVKNMHILRAIELLPVNKNNEPKLNVYISDCNEVGEGFFKKKNISAREKYINSLFSTLKVRQNGEEGVEGEGDSEEEEEEEEEEYEDEDEDEDGDGKIGEIKDILKCHIGENEKGTEHKKKRKGNISEKKEGVELLKKVLLRIEEAKCQLGFASDNKSRARLELQRVKKGEEKIEARETKEEEEADEEEEEEGSREEEQEKDEEKKQQRNNNKDYNKKSNMDYDPSNHTQSKTYEEDLTKKMSPLERKLLELQLKMNEAKIMNRKEVLREMEYGNANTEMKSVKDLLEYRQQEMETLTGIISSKNENKETDKNGDGEESVLESFLDEAEAEIQKDKDSSLLNTNAIKAYDRLKKNKKSSGYVLDNDMNLYKKIKFDVPFNRTLYEQKKRNIGEENFYGNNMLINETAENTEAQKNKVVEFCKKQEQLRSKFSRKRKEERELFKNYVNVRNKVYNKKLDRYFNKYTVEIRQNLEKK